MRMVIVRKQHKKNCSASTRNLHRKQLLWLSLCAARFASERFSRSSVAFVIIPIFCTAHFAYVWNVPSPKKRIDNQNDSPNINYFWRSTEGSTGSNTHTHLLIYILLSWGDQLLCSQEVITCGKSYSANGTSTGDRKSRNFYRRSKSRTVSNHSSQAVTP